MSKIYNWLTQNSKMKKMSGAKTFNWGIPAYKNVDGFKTCPNAAACVKGCYAKMGAYTFSNVAKVFENRLTLAQSAEFETVINSELKRRKVERLRIHDSGDFFSAQYLNKWIRIIAANPDVQFYAYTKMVSLFKGYIAHGAVPTNFKVIFSYGGTEDKLINRETDRHSMVFPTVSALKKAGYADAHVNDTVALGKNPKIGLVYHGTKLMKNTDWGKVKA